MLNKLIGGYVSERMIKSEDLNLSPLFYSGILTRSFLAAAQCSNWSSKGEVDFNQILILEKKFSWLILYWRNVFHSLQYGTLFVIDVIPWRSLIGWLTRNWSLVFIQVSTYEGACASLCKIKIKHPFLLTN